METSSSTTSTTTTTLRFTHESCWLIPHAAGGKTLCAQDAWLHTQTSIFTYCTCTYVPHSRLASAWLAMLFAGRRPTYPRLLHARHVNGNDNGNANDAAGTPLVRCSPSYLTGQHARTRRRRRRQRGSVVCIMLRVRMASAAIYAARRSAGAQRLKKKTAHLFSHITHDTHMNPNTDANTFRRWCQRQRDSVVFVSTIRRRILLQKP